MPAALAGVIVWTAVSSTAHAQPNIVAAPPPPPPPIISVVPPDNLPYTRPASFPADVAVLNDPASWVTPPDYPATALAQRREGRVGVEAVVSNYGRVTECRVVQTSGASDLDEAACRMVSQRARFRPAYDSEGRAVQGTYRTTIVWRLPLAPQFGTFSAAFEYDVEADGSMKNCKVVAMTGNVPASLLNNNPCTKPVRYAPEAPGQGQSRRRHYKLTYGAEVSELP